jgi:hypothetical protein
MPLTMRDIPGEMLVYCKFELLNMSGGVIVLPF